MVDVIQRRSSVIEGRHPFSAILVADGGVVEQLGDDVVSTWRSAAKPFQLDVSLESLDASTFSQDELAIGAASHSSEPHHIAVVERVMEKVGADVSMFRCGGHAPVHEPSAHAIIRKGVPFADIHNNCSGKHAFMIGATLARAWPADYRDPGHPLQQRIRARVEQLCETSTVVAVDGCGVPTFCAPISAFARAWHQFSVVMSDAPGSTLGRIGWAMAERADLTSGTGRLDAAVVDAALRPLAVKIGAMGLFCIAVPGVRAGVVVKVHSGDRPALAVAVAWVLERWFSGHFKRPDDWPWAVVNNVRGAPVGDRAVRF